jgi:hypothetical protein
MRFPKIAVRNFLLCLSVVLLSISSAKALTIDTVISFSPGAGSGVFDNSGGSWAGPSGAGTYDPAAVTALDGVLLALGGTGAAPGQITVGFSAHSVIDGGGADIRIYDTIGVSEGLIVEASSDGVSFFGMGSYDGLPAVGCSLAVPCAFDFDLATAGLLSASIFRITVADRVATGFPQAFDLDTLEALNYQLISAVPVPAAIWLFGTALVGFIGVSRRRKVA